MELLRKLIGEEGLDWSRIEVFHLDEYVGLGIDHRASFAGYIRDRLLIPAGVRHFHLIDGAAKPEVALAAANQALRGRTVDLALLGIGENGHLAFNDPPADFVTEEPYLLVDLDVSCRGQQVSEGWFETLEEVPRRAISMSVRQILKAREIVCLAPDLRKSVVVRQSFEGPVTPEMPASILQTHAGTTVFLDTASASLLRESTGRME